MLQLALYPYLDILMDGIRMENAVWFPVHKHGQDRGLRAILAGSDSCSVCVKVAGVGVLSF